MSFFGLLLVISALFSFNFAQQCIPFKTPAITHGALGDDVEWTYVSKNTYRTTISMVACDVDVAPGTIASFTTRCFDGMIPGYTLRMERGFEYQVTLDNTLGPENVNDSLVPINNARHPNHTNMHTHGLHISGEALGDYIFQEIEPEDSYTFTYKVPCNHAGGTMWYHPHSHGSTAGQAGGGAAGLLIVEDNQELENLPDWLVSMEEILLTIYHVNLETLATRYVYTEDDEMGFIGNLDQLFKYEADPVSEFTEFHLVNGKFQPTICINSNQWYRVRISYASINQLMVARIPGCTKKLLAKDGVLLHGTDNITPRDIGELLIFTTGTRADILLHCPYAGTDPSYYQLITGQDVLATFKVSGTSTTPTNPIENPTEFNPIRPEYLVDLQDETSNFHIFEDGNDTTTITITGSSINGDSFVSEKTFFYNISVGSYVKFYVTSNTHPFHMHVNHMQIMGIPDNEEHPLAPGWFERGDYHDILHGNVHVRFYTSTYGGNVVMHCHILNHEDNGAMGTFQILGGCDPFEADIDPVNYPGTCSANLPVCMTSSPTLPTLSPTKYPTPGTSAPTTTVAEDNDFYLNFVFSTNNIATAQTSVKSYKSTIKNSIRTVIESRTSKTAVVDIVGYEFKKGNLTRINASVSLDDENVDTAYTSVSETSFKSALETQLQSDLNDNSLAITSDVAVSSESNNKNNKNNGGGLSTVEIVLIVICIILFLIIVGGIIYIRNNKDNSKITADDIINEPVTAKQINSEFEMNQTINDQSNQDL